jgi:hypothetical protein
MFLLKSIFNFGEKTSTMDEALIEDICEASQHKRLAVFDTTQNIQGHAVKSKFSIRQPVSRSSQLLCRFGKQGKGKGQLKRPGGVAVTSQGKSRCPDHIYTDEYYIMHVVEIDSIFKCTCIS